MAERMTKVLSTLSPDRVMGRAAPYTRRDIVSVYMGRLFPLSVFGMGGVGYVAWDEGLDAFSAGFNSSSIFLLYALLVGPYIETLLFAVFFHFARWVGVFPTEPTSGALFCSVLALLFSLAHHDRSFIEYFYTWVLGFFLANIMFQHWCCGHQRTGFLYTWLAHQIFNTQVILFMMAILQLN
ncbi:MAG: hypothetical protein ING75_06120 [Rhodocyclaceae bacterium]|nr:hypothetical protein [Rhodocyclaceae bacterium]